MSGEYYLLALFAHWFVDFPVQAAFHRWMGHKATKFSHLVNHVWSYLLAFLLVFIAGYYGGPASVGIVAFWVITNAVLHGVIDFWTSRGTLHYWKRHLTALQNRWKFISENPSFPPEKVTVSNHAAGRFFTIIGFDQMLHVGFLLWSGYALGVL